MRKLILPSRIEGKVATPPSKSQTIRALAAGCLAEGESLILNPSFCNDALACLRLVQQLGAKVKRITQGTHQGLKIEGGFPGKNLLPPRVATFLCGESALTMRLMAALFSLQSNPVRLAAEGSLRRRPMDMVEESLKQLGVICHSQAGFPPLYIKGPMKPGFVRLDGSRSSQFLTGLLMSLPLLSDDSEVLAIDLKSKPYIELTLELIKKFGIEIKVAVESENYRFTIPGNQSYKPVRIEIEGDWSGASFLIVAGALTGRIELTGLRPDSRQADRRILEALKMARGKFRWKGRVLIIEQSDLRAFEFDASDCPDLFPPLCVLALGAKGLSRIKGAHRLKIKESNRAASLITELRRVGAKIDQEGDDLIIEGRRPVGGMIDSNSDHRIAMAGAVAGLISREGITIRGAEAVTKSFPDFFEKIKLCKGIVR